jgi:hypothetical protein
MFCGRSKLNYKVVLQTRRISMSYRAVLQPYTSHYSQHKDFPVNASRAEPYSKPQTREVRQMCKNGPSVNSASHEVTRGRANCGARNADMQRTSLGASRPNCKMTHDHETYLTDFSYMCVYVCACLCFCPPFRYQRNKPFLTPQFKTFCRNVCDLNT